MKSFILAEFIESKTNLFFIELIEILFIFYVRIWTRELLLVLRKKKKKSYKFVLFMCEL